MKEVENSLNNSNKTVILRGNNKEIIEKKIISENEFRKFLRTRVEDIIFNLFKPL